MVPMPGDELITLMRGEGRSLFEVKVLIQGNAYIVVFGGGEKHIGALVLEDPAEKAAVVMTAVLAKREGVRVRTFLSVPHEERLNCREELEKVSDEIHLITDDGFYLSVATAPFGLFGAGKNRHPEIAHRSGLPVEIVLRHSRKA
jgi:hypothetical protein